MRHSDRNDALFLFLEDLLFAGLCRRCFSHVTSTWKLQLQLDSPLRQAHPRSIFPMSSPTLSSYWRSCPGADLCASWRWYVSAALEPADYADAAARDRTRSR